MRAMDHEGSGLGCVRRLNCCVAGLGRAYDYPSEGRFGYDVVRAIAAHVLFLSLCNHAIPTDQQDGPPAGVHWGKEFRKALESGKGSHFLGARDVVA